MAATFIGWCLSVFSPCMSPAKICRGTVIAAKTTAAVSMRRPASTWVPRRRYHAPTPPMTKQVVMNEPSAMCVSRYGKEGLNTTCHQSRGCTMPSTSSNPAGVCSQLLEARIQNVDTSVPSATMQVEAKCRRGDTRPQPNIITPRKLASRKNAVSTS